jgi:predicted site-specific integrase-resolvase
MMRRATAMSTTTEPEQAYFNWQEAAAFAGYSVSTVKKWAAEGKFPVFRPSPGRVAIPREALKKCIEVCDDGPRPPVA